MKDIYRARDITEAHIVAGMLRSRGIEANVAGFFLQGGVGELASQDFARVQVEDADEAAARAVIGEYESAPRADTESDVESANGMAPGLVVVLVFLAVFTLGYLLMG